ncbi:cell division protein ZapD [Gammaproteobacteria bacterium]
MGRIQEQPGVDRKALEQTLKTLGSTIGQIQQVDGQIGQLVREDEMLRTVAQRSGILGGTCSFDLPQFHHWLQRPHAERIQQMNLWMAQLLPVRDAIRVVLSFIRNSSMPTTQVAKQGFFQDVLDPQAPIQMIRVGIDEQGTCFPEISGHRHRFTIRFLQVSVESRPVQTPQDIRFGLTRCMI